MQSFRLASQVNNGLPVSAQPDPHPATQNPLLRFWRQKANGKMIRRRSLKWIKRDQKAQWEIRWIKRHLRSASFPAWSSRRTSVLRTNGICFLESRSIFRAIDSAAFFWDAAARRNRRHNLDFDQLARMEFWSFGLSRVISCFLRWLGGCASDTFQR